MGGVRRRGHHGGGTVLIGSNLLTIFIAVTAWRNRARWVWIAMWYWPLMFGAHYLMYGDGLLKNGQIAWIGITVLVLGSTYRRFFGSASVEGA